MIVNRYNYTPINRETIDGKRHYCLPDGSKVPSVTTILDRTKSEEKRQVLANWRRRVGEQKAQEITTEAANRGTRMHAYLEHYMLNDDMKPLPGNPFAHPSWFMAAEVILQGLCHVNEFWGAEVPVYYSGLYAGTTDCLGVWKKRPAIMDFKQTNKPKKREWIDDYFVQLCAYAEAHNELHGTRIRKGVILMCVKPDLDEQHNIVGKPQYQEFVLEGAEFDRYRDLWWKKVEQYYMLNT